MLTEQTQGLTATPERQWSSISAVVIRADGTKENRGIISFSHRNPFINFFVAPASRFNGWLRERWFSHKRRTQ